MSSLPILNSQTPSSGKISASISGNGATTADDIANGAAPFGELLARQLTPQGRDLKSDLLKNIALADSDKLAADPGLSSSQISAEVRTDGVALPSDFLASLLPQDKRAALSGVKDPAAESAVTVTSDLSEKMDMRASAAQRSAATQAGEEKPDARLSSAGLDGAHDKRANSGITPDTTFAAALQAEKKAGIRVTAGQTDSIIQPAQTANTTNAAIGMPNTQPTSATQVTAAQATVNTPLNQPQWADDFSQKVTWLATQRTQSAELHLNPAQLGPLEISLKLHGDQATLQFTSAHAAVRDAIEQSIPRLRDMLADSGISLGNTTVSDQAPREQQREQASRMGSSNNADNALESNITQTQSTTLLRRHDGVVDTFA